MHSAQLNRLPRSRPLCTGDAWHARPLAAMLRDMNDALYIDHDADLQHFCTQLAGSQWLSLDTEFVREKTYYPKLCLIQISNGEHLACIDPLAINDLAPLFDLLYDPAITKVWHACSQDMEIFAHLRGDIPAPLFDTQLAASLLGHGNQISYAALVKELCDIELDKSHSRTDWSRRPLSAEQLTYAADDVRYLCTLYETLRDELAASGRGAWLDEDFHAMTDSRRYLVDASTIWQQVKGLEVLYDVQLAVLQALAEWREKRAQKSDKPRRWILNDELLIALAQNSPQDAAGLSEAGLSDKARDRFGSELLVLIRQALATPKEQWPVIIRRERPTAEEKKLGNDLMKVVKRVAQEHAIDPALLATRKTLNALMTGQRELPVLQGWRKKIVGDKLLELLE
ncbi:ribonuclease D [Sulfuriflexus mobilis]|uniref:ribonuclease D n=1 Tax=Sulfuriflexus mobilis TaxID=1811807 RepID=UPI000F82C39D|nr:ribonuclease D [Sulfuriflexus mobilis]